MLKTSTALVLLSLAAGPAVAQTTQPQPGAGTATGQPTATQIQPVTPRAASDTTPGTSGSANVRYITGGQNLWRASQLSGVNVYNDQNEKIGDITDVLVDRQGAVEGVIIGVGGFLGIGQRDVAVPFNELQWQMTNDTTGTNRSANGASAPTTGSTVAPTTSTARTGDTGAHRDRPAKAILAGASKDQLKNAPEYRAGG
jgi:sporulation protein YlmC with PRC-barrel domain